MATDELRMKEVLYVRGAVVLFKEAIRNITHSFYLGQIIKKIGIKEEAGYSNRNNSNNNKSK